MLNMVNPHDDNHDGAEDETPRHIQWTLIARKWIDNWNVQSYTVPIFRSFRGKNIHIAILSLHLALRTCSLQVFIREGVQKKIDFF